MKEQFHFNQQNTHWDLHEINIPAEQGRLMFNSGYLTCSMYINRCRRNVVSDIRTLTLKDTSL